MSVTTRMATIVTFGEYARHDGVFTAIAVDPMTGEIPARLWCAGPNPSDLHALFIGDPEPTGHGVVLHREAREPSEHEKTKAHWRYVQSPAAPADPAPVVQHDDATDGEDLPHDFDTSRFTDGEGA